MVNRKVRRKVRKAVKKAVRAKVKGHMRKVPGRSKKIRVAAYMRNK